MHLEALKSEQKTIFESLSNFSDFYLVGGTALALQIGHRVSVDFDLFSNQDIPPSLIRKVNRIFPKSKIKIILSHSEQLSLLVKGVKLDFVKYDFPVILDFIEFHKVRMLKIPEIAAMKAYTLNYRGTLKDYIDLYFILKNKYCSLIDIKNITAKKYKDRFNFRLFLEQLIYLKDLEEKKIDLLDSSVSRKEIQAFFEKEVSKIKT